MGGGKDEPVPEHALCGWLFDNTERNETQFVPQGAQCVSGASETSAAMYPRMAPYPPRHSLQGLEKPMRLATVRNFFEVSTFSFQFM